MILLSAESYSSEDNLKIQAAFERAESPKRRTRNPQSLSISPRDEKKVIGKIDDNPNR
jgi:hypothetical protein